MRTICTTPGIGDSIWVLQKIINARERFNWRIHDGFPRRGKQIFDLLPQVGPCEYAPNLSYNFIRMRATTRMAHTWGRIRIHNIYLEANSHLESGKRIEQYLPDLPTSYSLPFETQQWEKEVAQDMVMMPSPLIGIYASSYATSRNWGFWGAKEWFQLIDMMARMIPGARFVIIGAQWDAPLAMELMNMLLVNNIPFVDTIGKCLGYVIEVMKLLDYAFYFPSGLGILSGLLGRPSTMFYNPTAHANLPRTWADPALIASGEFNERFFCTPQQAFEYVRDEFKLEARL